ncbi:MAG: hypothetical protein MUF15_05505, partial [Acidobacteria bacterium]|nr:hypothetical protein [Acidobacteriota bacterium]
MMAIAELQRSAKDYRLEQKVFTVVVLTAPYRIDDNTHLPIKDEVLISSADPRNLKGKEIHVYGHKLIFLNHHYRNDNTPVNYRDWLDLFYESIHNPDDYHLNLSNQGIKKAVELIDYDKLTPEARHLMKIAEQRRVVRKMDDEKARKEGLEEGREEGRKEGLEEGREEGRKEGLEEGIKEGLEKGREEKSIKMAKIMKEEGEPISKIMKYTGLSENFIKEL